MARAFVGLALLSATAVTVVAAKPGPERPARRRAVNLFAVTNGVLNVNRVFCGINNLGELCVDPTNSPVVGGGFWPKGTPDQYIFNSGLQLAGMIPAGAGGGKPAFPWAGDTVGAYFFDARGTQVQGDAITLVYNSLDVGDAAAWPAGAFVNDTNIYHPILKQRADSGALHRDGSGISISQQDLWTRAWDGNPGLLSGRTHPMGILVEERGVAWNYPTGNEDIIYFLFTFYNVTASSCAVYGNLFPHVQDLIRRTALQNEICAVGQNFQSRNEAVFNFNIPDGGYAIDSLYSAFSMDPDVGDAGANYSTAILPFNMGVAYKADFLEPNWSFPPDIFGAPFVSSPGFVGVKYLRSPKVGGVEVGLSMFSNTRNAATGFPDPVGVIQLYRYLSGKVSPALGDNPCTVNPITQKMCFLDQAFTDTRFFESSGPFTLAPGESQTIVVAYVHAAPTPAVLPFIGGDMKPGIPAPGDSIFADPSRVRTIERAAGWVSAADSNGNNIIEQNEVTSVKRSLLDKALRAQAVYNNKFLLPFAPEGPRFFLVPGDNQVTIAWQPSETETIKSGGGDPFFSIASQPFVFDSLGNPSANPLYDPNFRQYDVEGYRIYRGRSTSQLELVAQFDYAGSEIIDYTGTFAYTTDTDGDGISECAPELGVQDDCPQTFPSVAGEPHGLVGDVIQVPIGGRVQLANGSILIVRADTAVTGNASGFPALTDGGIGFGFVDRSVRNSFTYHYAVTAFDVNSFTSGPSALESPRVTKSVTPRKLGSNATAAVLVQGLYGANGALLNANASWPTIDPAAGTFTGTIPPANDGQMLFTSAVVEALAAGNIAVRFDSQVPGFADGIGTGPTIWVTVYAGTDSVRKGIPLLMPAFNASRNTNTSYAFDQPIARYDSSAARRFGIQFTKDVRMPLTFSAGAAPISATSVGISLTAGRYDVGGEGSRYLAHSRWSDSTAPETADPTIVAYADKSHNAGALTGVDSIWGPEDYRMRVSLVGANSDAPGPFGAPNLGNFRGYGFGQTAWYPADFYVTWNADSSVTVRDSTHRVTLPVAKNGGTGYGFLNVRAYLAAGVTAGTNPPTDIDDGTGTPNINVVGYHHIYGMPPDCFPEWWAIPCVQLEAKAQYEPVDFNWNGVADGNGIALAINGEVFIMKMAAIPAAGKRWHLRAITGSMTATCTPGLAPVMTDCSNYAFTPPTVRPSRAPGLTYQVTVSQQFAVDSTVAGDLSRVHTVPDPYYVTNSLEITPNTKILKFVNLPNRAIVRIYSVSGVLVQVLTQNDVTGGGELTWNLRNRNQQFVASGVYFYHVEGPDGQTKVGRFTVVNFAQ
ncbi:MAG TPA: T9SS type A sorting domain-containing protein [Gemmatimonadales bacterium]|nr:T9SS type A sorting domain-containing protein [Gemmatimonadales bacterium]